MLLDSNIIIYAALPEYRALQDFIAKHAPAVSAISRVEVLGYHLLTQQDRSEFEEFFAAATVLPVSDLVITKAIELRQVRKLKLGDALIAGKIAAMTPKIPAMIAYSMRFAPGTAT